MTFLLLSVKCFFLCLQDQISDVVIQSVDGALICEFTRATRGTFTYYGLTGAEQHTVDLSSSIDSADYYLYVAWGSAYVGMN